MLILKSRGEDYAVIDVETLPKLQTVSMWRKGIKNWINIIEQQTGKKPIVYSGESFFADFLKVDPFFKDYPRLWIASYNLRKKPKHNWIIWQFSDRIKIEGINELCDFNVFRHSKSEFLELLK